MSSAAMTTMRAILMASVPVRTPTSASTSAGPFAVLPKQLTPQVPANSFQMHKVTISTTVAGIFLVLPACSLTKVCYWREVNNDWPPSIKPPGTSTAASSSLWYFAFCFGNGKLDLTLRRRPVLGGGTRQRGLMNRTREIWETDREQSIPVAWINGRVVDDEPRATNQLGLVGAWRCMVVMTHGLLAEVERPFFYGSHVMHQGKWEDAVVGAVAATVGLRLCGLSRCFNALSMMNVTTV